MSLSTRDAELIDRWWRHCLTNPGVLPPGVEPVLTRMVRAVGSGVLPDRGRVFVKVMGFPRLRHRLRYAVRSLPAIHEARMLECARRAGLTVPEVVVARGQRARGLPLQSMLVTAALDVDDIEPDGLEVALAALAMADAGVFHPDLNPGNFTALRGGGIGVLDLQSARASRRPLPRGQRLAMAAKLLAERPDCASALVEVGLIDQRGLSEAQLRARRILAAGCLRRIGRCLQDSTEFRVERRWNGKLFERRAMATDHAVRVRGGRELVHCWIGDRALEVLDARSPRLRSLFRKSWWLPGEHSVYICQPDGQDLSPAARRSLLNGHGRFLEVRRGRVMGDRRRDAAS